MPTIYDNKEFYLNESLKRAILFSKRVDFCVGYFNLRGWNEVATEIDALAGDDVEEKDATHFRYCRLLVGMQKLPQDILREHFFRDDNWTIDNQEAAKMRKRLAQEFRQQLVIGPPSDQDEHAIRTLTRQLKEGRVVVKLHLRHLLHAKLYLAYGNHAVLPVMGFLGSSNLTLAGLSKQGELNIDVVDNLATEKLVEWFEDRWQDRWCIDITKDLIEILEDSWAADKLHLPYHIYLKVAYHLSREARAGISEFRLSRVFQNELLPFQQTAVLVAAKHLHKRGGVLLGDVVGLGKTITATALAKIFEDDFFLETLILCPKNLVTMWEGYAHKYQLRAKVLSQSKAIKALQDLRRYRIVIIDESHNLRNDQGKRYRAIKAYLQENDSKVILLSATPYNKGYGDLSNQLRLFLEDDADLGITPERYIAEIGGQVEFSSQHTETFIRSIKAFEKSSHPEDWQELMRLYLVRRTRSFIKTNYAKFDDEVGRYFLTFHDGSRSYFPDRIPKKVEYDFDPDDPTDQYAQLYSDEVVKRINDLALPRYGLGLYVNERQTVPPTAAEGKILENLTRAGRRLVGFCRTNLFKRLESSGQSFLLSLSRHVLRNYIFIYALQNRLPLPIGKQVAANLDDFLNDIDPDATVTGQGQKADRAIILDPEVYLRRGGEIYRMYEREHQRKFQWLGSSLFTPKLLKSLISDGKQIIEILKLAKEWKPEADRQLNALHALITEAHRDEKILVFTQFADTAEYLLEQLKKRGVTHIDMASGDSDNPTDLAHRFSPRSNERPELAGTSSEIRVLIATDVLSEGQNLQDSHIVLNYDLPWAIIRLIQRAGRVDRIGQKAKEILCYSFLPEDGIERIIRLRKRLSDRISENAEVVGADETFFEGDPVNVTDLYNEKSGILDDDDEMEVDLASYAYQIWKNAIDADPKLQKIIPDLSPVIYATKAVDDIHTPEGTVIYTRTPEDNDVLAWIDTRRQVVTQSQFQILKALQCNALTPALQKMDGHNDAVKTALEIIRHEETKLGGTLGRKTGVKYRLYNRLKRFCDQYANTLFVTDNLKRAVDDIFKYPLKEFARDTISRQMKSGIDDHQLVELVVSLREDEKLCTITDDDADVREYQIICSMGLKNSQNLLP